MSVEAVLGSLQPLLRPRSVLLIGELPGTEEFPGLIARLARSAVAQGLAVTVGLEVACSEQTRLDRAVDAAVESGLDSDEALLGLAFAQSGPWWRRADRFQDGRSSRAMLDLVSTLVGLAGAGGDVAIVAADGPWVAPGSPVPLELLGILEQPRDEVMATCLLDAIDRRPKAVTLALAGVEHTRCLDTGGESAAGRAGGADGESGAGRADGAGDVGGAGGARGAGGGIRSADGLDGAPVCRFPGPFGPPAQTGPPGGPDQPGVPGPAGDATPAVEPGAAGVGARLGAGPGPVRPFGQLVRAWHPETIALRGRAGGGTAWRLDADFGLGSAADVAPDPLPEGAHWTDTPGRDGHHGYVHVGPVTASYPAG
ncbi:MAG: hypothetical protein AAF547_18585 [Actinomycetota bacterium]